MLKTIEVVGGLDVVNVILECDDHLLVNSGTFWTIYGREWQGKRNVMHVGEKKYIQRVWDKYCKGLKKYGAWVQV